MSQKSIEVAFLVIVSDKKITDSKSFWVYLFDFISQFLLLEEGIRFPSVQYVRQSVYRTMFDVLHASRIAPSRESIYGLPIHSQSGFINIVSEKKPFDIVNILFKLNLHIYLIN